MPISRNSQLKATALLFLASPIPLFCWVSFVECDPSFLGSSPSWCSTDERGLWVYAFAFADPEIYLNASVAQSSPYYKEFAYTFSWKCSYSFTEFVSVRLVNDEVLSSLLAFCPELSVTSE